MPNEIFSFTIIYNNIHTISNRVKREFLNIITSGWHMFAGRKWMKTVGGGEIPTSTYIKFFPFHDVRVLEVNMRVVINKI